MWGQGGCYHRLIEYARNMREHPTEAEAKLWELLQAHWLEGLHFRRQHVMENFIVDFLCLRKALIIEVDGPIHDQPEQMDYDQHRTKVLEELGFTLVRFTNDEVLRETEVVRAKICHYLKSLPDLKLIFPAKKPPSMR